MLKNRIEKKNLIINSLIDLQEEDGKGKGRYFISRFIEPGLAHYKELGDIVITKETLDKFIQSMVGCPVIIDHKDVTDKNVDKLRVGTISRVWYDERDGWYYCEGILTDDEAINLVKNQGWNVSCSYSFVSDDTQKTYHGKPIDMVFTDGEFLHLAIVEDPRYEGANIVVNSNEVIQDKGDIFDEYFDKNKVENSNKENIIMQVLDELKNFILGVVNNEKEDEMKVKNEDKRKLIDEIGGILKDKVDDEIIRTVIKKAEELSYEPSEDDKADNKCKNEDDEDKKEDKKETENKCKNEEDKKEDKKVEDEDDDKDVTKNEEDKKEEKEVKNSMKDLVMGGNGKAEEQKLYISRKERLEEGNKY